MNAGDLAGLIAVLSFFALVLIVLGIAVVQSGRQRAHRGGFVPRWNPSNPAGLPYRPPTPPWHAQHAEGCPARAAFDKRRKPRVRVCACCGKEVKHRHPSPPRKR